MAKQFFAQEWDLSNWHTMENGTFCVEASAIEPFGNGFHVTPIGFKKLITTKTVTDDEGEVIHWEATDGEDHNFRILND